MDKQRLRSVLACGSVSCKVERDRKPKLTPPQKAAITRVINGFDFEIVRAYMLMTGWRWYFTEGVPTIDQLKSSARDRLGQAIASGGSGSGGLAATFQAGYLELVFEIERSSCATNFAQ